MTTEARIILDGTRVGVSLPNTGIIAGNNLADHVIWLDPDCIGTPGSVAVTLVAAWNLYAEIVGSGGSPEMNLAAWRHGLAHWKCVKRDSNAQWRRADGAIFEFTGRKSWPECLREYDRENPMQPAASLEGR